MALSEYSHIGVEIYEGATQLGEVGAGIGFWPREFQIVVSYEWSNLFFFKVHGKS